jgi:hypothetical protein
MFAAILAAQMSTLSAFMVAASALVSRNIYKKHFNPAADEAHMLRVARFGGLIIVFLGVIFALKVGGVADALVWFWTLATFTGLFMWAGVLWRRTNATGAWASFAVMLAIWLYVGEPGQAVSQHFAVRRDMRHTQIESYNKAQPRFTRLLLDVGTMKGQELQRKDVLVLFSKESQVGLGLKVRPGGPDVLEGPDPLRLPSKRIHGSTVTSVDDAGFARPAGIKPGDVILGCAKLGTPGIFADKKLLHYRLLAFLPAGILALILGSLLGKPHPKDKLDKFYALIKTPVGRESELIEQGVDVVYAGQSKGHPWELKHQRAVNVVGFLIALVLSGLFFLLLWGLTRIGA